MRLPPLIGPADPGAPRVLSVCSGVGGKDLGFHRAGFRTVGLCEWEPWRRAALARHWPGVPCHPDLVALCEWAERDPDAVRDWLGGQPDLLIGGTPCQDLSSAGRRAGLAGARSGLFFAYARLRLALGIEWCVWENVAGALTSNAGLDFMAVVGALVGADVALPSRAEGAPDRASRPGPGCPPPRARSEGGGESSGGRPPPGRVWLAWTRRRRRPRSTRWRWSTRENAPATAGQIERAATAATTKAGLRGKCLALWVITGDDASQQIARARARRPLSARAGSSTRASTYPDEIREAVRIAVEARGTRAGAPGPKQHVLVRGALTDPSDPGAILRDAGVGSLAQLRRIASGEAPRVELEPLRALAEKVDDPFCRGRNLASILVAAMAQAPSVERDPDAERRARKARAERERRARVRAEG